MEIVCRDRENLKELQADITGYMLGEVIWTSRNEPQETWWFLWCRILKILISGLEMIFRTIKYDKWNIWLCVMHFEIMQADLIIYFELASRKK